MAYNFCPTFLVYLKFFKFCAKIININDIFAFHFIWRAKHICPPQILIIRRINMSSKTIRSKFVHNHTIQELLRAKSIEFTCLLSTQEQVQSHKATLTLTQRSLGEPRWYLDGSPLTSYATNKLIRVLFLFCALNNFNNIRSEEHTSELQSLS